MPDLVILDIMMPVLNGIQLCKIFQATPGLKHIPIAMLSALSDPGSKRDSYNAGAKVFLTKPIQSRELVQIIKDLIG
jgi:CheY-like chemotaxis protein